MDKIIQFLTDTGIIINPENHPFIIEQFISEMERGLAGKTPSLKMIPSHYAIGHRFSHTPVIKKAGMVNMAPAARASPTAPVVLARFSSKIVPLNGRSTAMAMTAAGKVAATVIPTIRPK